MIAGFSVTDYERAVAWYTRLLGSGPSFLPNSTEAVWEIREHGYVFVEVRPEHAGHAEEHDDEDRSQNCDLTVFSAERVHSNLSFVVLVRLPDWMTQPRMLRSYG